MSRIYCDKKKVHREFIDRWKNKGFSEQYDRDNIEFWEQQQKEYLQVNPDHSGIFEPKEFQTADKDQKGHTWNTQLYSTSTLRKT